MRFGMPILKINIIALVFMLLSSCSSAPYLVYQPDQAVRLAPKEGLLAVRLKFSGNIDYVEIEGQTRGTSDLMLMKPKSGYDLRILRVTSGTYCVYRFGSNDGWFYYTKGNDRYCFEVRQGTLNYFGDIIEQFRAVRSELNYKKYLTQLQSEHPALFQQFIMAEKR